MRFRDGKKLTTEVSCPAEVDFCDLSTGDSKSRLCSKKTIIYTHGNTHSLTTELEIKNCLSMDLLSDFFQSPYGHNLIHLLDTMRSVSFLSMYQIDSTTILAHQPTLSLLLRSASAVAGSLVLCPAALQPPSF